MDFFGSPPGSMDYGGQPVGNCVLGCGAYFSVFLWWPNKLSFMKEISEDTNY